MNFEFKKVEGSQLIKPSEFEKDENTGYVWLRKDITEIERYDEMSGTTIKLWQYNELGLNKAEYEEYLKYKQAENEKYIHQLEKQRADIDFIAIMSDIELEG